MPLSDIKVLDLSIARAGPTAVRQLADWGAEIIRVEAPATGDDFTGDPSSSDYLNLHRNKRGITVDLKQPEGAEIVYRLAEWADVLVENFRPPVKKRLKVDYESISARNPRLVYGSISGFGQDGPYADKGAVDQIIQGMGGLMSITGIPGQGPVRVGIAVADVAAGHELAIGILVALREREKSGKGQWVHVSLLEAMISFLDFQATRWTVDGVVPGQAGNDHPTAFPMGAFATKDGYINIAASSNRLWRRFVEVLGDKGLLEVPEYAEAELRSANREALYDRIQNILVSEPTGVWWKRMDEAGIPCGPINTIDQVFADPQVEHLQMTVEVDHPLRGTVAILRQPVNMTRTPPAVHSPSPLPRQDRDAVLADLGYSEDDVERLAASKVV